MPLRSVMLPLFVLLVGRPVFAQGWVESFGFLDAAGNPVRYRPFDVNRLPEPQGGQ